MGVSVYARLRYTIEINAEELREKLKKINAGLSDEELDDICADGELDELVPKEFATAVGLTYTDYDRRESVYIFCSSLGAECGDKGGGSTGVDQKSLDPTAHPKSIESYKKFLDLLEIKVRPKWVLYSYMC